jgi:energy-coupling factor transport system ATP-binding protein
MNETTPESTPVIEIRNLSFQYPLGTLPSIKNINLKIQAGEYVVIAGPTGSGKTTLAICLNGIIPHLVEGELSGEVVIDGMGTLTHPVHELTSSIGLVFQNPEDQLFSLNVTDEVAFGVENMGYTHPEIVERVDKAIERVGLNSRKNYSIFHLSGGQKQKVAIATNLAISPKILVLDSPTADLDPISSMEVVNTLVELRKQEPSKTFIVIDSDISDVINLADRIIVMNEGEIVLDTTPIDLLRNHFDEVIKIGIRIPDHVRLMHWLVTQLPDLKEFSLEEGEVQRLVDRLIQSGQLHFREPAEVKSDPDKPSIINFDHVSFNYPKGPVILEDTSLDIKNGEWLAIIGENGTGKSTLLKLICGLIKPNSGVVTTAGVNTASKNLDDVLNNVGYLFQNPDNQLFMSTVEDEIGFGPGRKKCTPEEIEARINEALDLMGLQDSRKKHPFTLSRGQRQRLAVATVLAARPRLLLLDEPTTGQDQIALDNLMNLTQNLIDQHGASVVMVTHDMDLVAQHASRVIVLDKGKILLDGTPLEIFANEQDVLARVSLKPPCMAKLTTGLSSACSCLTTWDYFLSLASVKQIAPSQI